MIYNYEVLQALPLTKEAEPEAFLYLMDSRDSTAREAREYLDQLRTPCL